MTYSYELPQVNACSIFATNSREIAGQYIEKGYSPFTVPQMFNMEDGAIFLYKDSGNKSTENGLNVLEEYEREVGNHISGGFPSCGHVKDNH